jgi:hypothetical protein
MKGVRGGENPPKIKQLMIEVQSRLFENWELISFFIIHSSLFTSACRHAPGHLKELKIKNEE